MKILQVVQFFSPNHGGSAMVPFELSKHLRDAGHDVTVITTDFQMGNEFINSLNGVKVIPFHCQLNIGGFLYSPSMNKYLRLNINEFDIIHMHNYRTYQNILVHKFAKKYKIPYILQAHGSVLPFFHKKGLKNIYDILFGKKILNNASKVIALTNTEADQYRIMGIKINNINIIPNGIDFHEYEKLPNKNEFKEKYNIASDEKVILYLGRIHKIKGLDLLLKAFHILNSKMDGLKLLIIGPDNGFLSVLKKKIDNDLLNDKVIVIDPIYGLEKLQAYVAADVFVLPSYYECFPTTILESSACGTPVVVTEGCNITEIVEKKIGLVAYLNEVDLSQAILNILSNDDLRTKFGDNARKTVKGSYDWSILVQKFEQLYCELTLT